MITEEFEYITKYLASNGIINMIRYPENFSMDDILVWLDLPEEDRYDSEPEGLLYTGGAIIDSTPEEIFRRRILYQHITFSAKYIQKHKEYISWDAISIYHRLTEDFIREFQDDLNWSMISSNQILSEDFIREFQNKVNWTAISIHQILSEEFIREFKGKVSWRHISFYQRSL
jgi:hypothetical protein